MKNATMRIIDSVYGRFDIQEPVLLELLESKAIRRLHNVHQSGASYLVRKGRDTSRLEHSIGVMLLIRLLGGSIEEQVAGLIHDVSHTAFSHVADHVFCRTDEDYHELHFQRLLIESDIPSILNRYSYDIAAVSDSERWSLLEQPSPKLCADRIDYTLRDLLCIQKITRSEIERFLSCLTVHQNEVVVTDLACATWFVNKYVVEVCELFMNPVELYANYWLAGIIRLGIERGYLTENDLFGTDNEVLRKLSAAGDFEVDIRLRKLTPQLRIVEDIDTYECHIKSKPRIVDPVVLLANSSLVATSSLDPTVHKQHISVVNQSKKGLYLRSCPV